MVSRHFKDTCGCVDCDPPGADDGLPALCSACGGARLWAAPGTTCRNLRSIGKPGRSWERAAHSTAAEPSSVKLFCWVHTEARMHAQGSRSRAARAPYQCILRNENRTELVQLRRSTFEFRVEAPRGLVGAYGPTWCASKVSNDSQSCPPPSHAYKVPARVRVVI